jgi:hypothetical protein
LTTANPPGNVRPADDQQHSGTSEAAHRGLGLSGVLLGRTVRAEPADGACFGSGLSSLAVSFDSGGAVLRGPTIEAGEGRNPMTVHAQHPHPAGHSSRANLVARAWTAVALIPVFFFVGFAVGEMLYAILGYKPENDDASLGVDLVTSLAVLAVTLVPCIAAVIYGRRANPAGRPSARAPMTIGALAGAALVILTALNL